MDKFAGLAGRQYHLFDYVGAPDAERVIVMMGSGAETAGETVEYSDEHRRKVGVLKVRLYRPFSVKHFLEALPPTVKPSPCWIAPKNPASAGEPLYQDVVTAVNEGWQKAVAYAQLPTPTGSSAGAMACPPKNSPRPWSRPSSMSCASPSRRTTSPSASSTMSPTPAWITIPLLHRIARDRALRVLGLGADGTVGANKNSIQIIGEETENYAQGYFVYDSKKSGSVTISHLRFGPKPIRAPYLISQAQFVACHQFTFLERFDVLKYAAPGGGLPAQQHLRTRRSLG